MIDKDCDKCEYNDYCDKNSQEEKTCLYCDYYITIDSGYGNCYAFPPEQIVKKKTMLGMLLKKRQKIVPFCMKSCACFKPKILDK